MSNLSAVLVTALHILFLLVDLVLSVYEPRLGDRARRALEIAHIVIVALDIPLSVIHLVSLLGH
jgi:hypothetical protein